MEKKYIIESLRGVVRTQKNICYSVNYLNNDIVLKGLELNFIENLLNNIKKLFEKTNLDLNNIMYMYKIGIISKRYWTKKKLLLKYSNKRKYSVYLNDESEKDPITYIHKKQVVLPIEAQYERYEYLYLKEPFIHLQIKNLIIINEEKKMYEQINNYLEDYKKRIELMKDIEKLDLNHSNKILKLYDDYNSINNNKKKTDKFFGIFKGNFTTDIKKDSIILVDSNKIQEKPLNKGIGFHNKNYFLGKIESDKDFVQIFSYIMVNFDNDLKQKILIEKNTEIGNLDELYNSQARKILKQIGLKKIIIDNKIKTKNQLLEYLIINWTKIKGE